MKDVGCAESKEKSNLRFFRFLFFVLSRKFIENESDLNTKSNLKWQKIGNILNLIFLSIQLIPDLSCIFGKKCRFIFLFKISKKKIQKFLNLQERSGISWIERKSKFLVLVFLFFEFWLFFYSKWSQFSMNFHP